MKSAKIPKGRASSPKHGPIRYYPPPPLTRTSRTNPTQNP